MPDEYAKVFEAISVYQMMTGCQKVYVDVYQKSSSPPKKEDTEEKEESTEDKQTSEETSKPSLKS